MSISTIVFELINLRFRKDVDGYLPIDYQLVNRNNQRFILRNNIIDCKPSIKDLYSLSSTIRKLSEETERISLDIIKEEE